MGMNLGRSAVQPGAYDLWIPGEGKVMTSSEVYFDETLYPWRKAGDQRVSDPVPQPGDAMARLDSTGGGSVGVGKSVTPLDVIFGHYDPHKSDRGN